MLWPRSRRAVIPAGVVGGRVIRHVAAVVAALEHVRQVARDPVQARHRVAQIGLILAEQLARRALAGIEIRNDGAQHAAELLVDAALSSCRLLRVLPRSTL